MKRITSEDQRTIQKVCPKFSRICQCYCNNPDYGVTLSPKAKNALNMAKKRRESNVKSKVVSVRLTLDEMDKLEKHLVETAQSISEFMKERMADVYKESSVQEGLPKQDSDVQGKL